MTEPTHFRPRDEGDPECILVAGHQGAGKSSGWATWARRMHETEAPGRVFVLDTTREVVRLLQGDRFYGLLRYEENRDKIHHPDGNVDLYMTGQWTTPRDKKGNVVVEDDGRIRIGMVEWVCGLRDESGRLLYKGVIDRAGPGDLIVVEMMNNVWQAVQDSYVRRIFGMDMSEFLMEAREAAQTKGAKGMKTLDRLMDWRPINALHNRFSWPLTQDTEADVYMTTKTKSLGENEKEEARKLYGPWGMKPGGQGDIGFQVHTILEFIQTRDEAFTITTRKDRERRRLVDEEWEDFGESYLLMCAGWKWGKDKGRKAGKRELAVVGADE